MVFQGMVATQRTTSSSAPVCGSGLHQAVAGRRVADGEIDDHEKDRPAIDRHQDLPVASNKSADQRAQEMAGKEREQQ